MAELGNRARIGDEQVQCLRAGRNETYRRLVEPAKEQCDRLTRHPNANEAPRARTREGESGPTSRPKQRIAVPEYQVSVALTRQAAPPDIDGEQEIVLPRPRWAVLRGARQTAFQTRRRGLATCAWSD